MLIVTDLVPEDAAHQLLDGWGGPFQYRVTGDSYELFSYGRDGLPGGSGLDADVYPGSYTWAEYPTLEELPGFLTMFFAWSSAGMPILCALAGVAIFFALARPWRRGTA